MAHFSQLDENNVVTQVIVVANEDTSDANGVEVEEIGVAFCKKLLGAETNWKQTSYNGNMRVRYAGVGYAYNEELDAFIPPQPFESWVLNTTTADWESPIGPAPELTEAERETFSFYRWNEENGEWDLVTPELPEEDPEVVTEDFSAASTAGTAGFVSFNTPEDEVILE
jgi:hypothetical protein